jgi:phosphoadenosine phosphosulfate reductase
MRNDLLLRLQHALDGKDAEGTVQEAVRILPADRVVLASSLSVEDQVLTHLLCAVQAQPRIFTLDTGRLFPETYETMERTMQRYGFRYEVLTPDTRELEEMIRTQGPNLFYRSVELRKRCCAVRKINPLRRVLATADAWLCGLRREQSVTRRWSRSRGMGVRPVQDQPLIDWTGPVWVIQATRFLNPCMAGYPAWLRPCSGGETGRRCSAGRWWWENPEHKVRSASRRPQEQGIYWTISIDWKPRASTSCARRIASSSNR